MPVEPIRGEVRLTLTDYVGVQFACASWPLLPISLLAGAFCGAALWISEIDVGFPLWLWPLTFAVGMILVQSVFLLLASVYYFWRMSGEQRRVRYEISDDGIAAGDPAGTTFTIRWEVVRKAYPWNRGIALYLKPYGVVWLCSRAFTPKAMAKLSEIIRMRLRR